MRTSPLKKIEHGIKRLFFTGWRGRLKKGRSAFSVIDPNTVRKVLFIRPEKLGDMVISLPVFRNLKRLYPHMEIYTICSPRNIAIIREDESITANFLYTKHIWSDLKMLRQVRRLRVDAVVDMIGNDSVTALMLTQYSSPSAWRIGVGKNLHRLYYDFNYAYRSDDQAHVIDNTIKLLTAFGIDTEPLNKQVPPTIESSHFDRVDEFIGQIRQDRTGPVIGLNLSAGRPTRVWQDEKNRSLIESLLKAYPGLAMVLSCDAGDRKRALALAGLFHDRVRPLPGGLDLLSVSALVSRLNLLITPDTSLVHIARAFNVPVVGLYTRFDKNFLLWKPYKQDGGAVVSGNDYNIHDIGVEEVYREVVRMLPPEEA